MLFLIVVAVLFLMGFLFWRDYQDAMDEEQKSDVEREMDDIIEKCKRFKDKK